MNRLFTNVLKQIRFSLTRRGYDIHPIDQNCWSDQQRLVSSLDVNTIFDVGANRGGVAATYRTLFPSSQIHCIEPLDAFASSLTQRFQSDDNIAVHQICLGEFNGQSRMFVNRSQDTSSLLAPHADDLLPAWTEAMTVESTAPTTVRTLDSFCDDHSIDHINILKMDTQGTELHILRGANRLLSNRKIDMIFAEVAFAPMYHGQALFGDVCRELLRSDYRFHYIYNQMFNGRSGKLFYADAIFVSPLLAEVSARLLRSYTSRQPAG
jgi:FkbM family methyltransferase